MASETEFFAEIKRTNTEPDLQKTVARTWVHARGAAMKDLADRGRHEAAFVEALGAIRAEYERVLAENMALQPNMPVASKHVHGLEDVPTNGGIDKDVAATKGTKRVEFQEVQVAQADVADHVDVVPHDNVLRKRSLKESRETIEAPRMRRSVFRSADDVRASLKPIVAGEEEHHYKPGTCAEIALHPYVQTLDLSMILVYAIWMGIDADWNDALLITESGFIFQAADHFFCLFFVLELGVRFFAFQGCCDRVRDGWFVFDAILVPLTIVDTWAA